MMSRSLLTIAVFAVLAAGASAYSCSGPERPGGAASGPADGGQADALDGGSLTNEIVFAPGTTFAKRDCSLTLTYAGEGTEVKVAGEFTDWAEDALPMTKTGPGFSITLEPGPRLRAAQLYAYKFLVDGTSWRIDPNNKYRKIVGGQMNSALMLPACEAGPELVSERLRASAEGNVSVRVRVRTAADGEPPSRLEARINREALPAGTWATDPQGGVTFTFKGLPKGKYTLSLRATDAKGRFAEPVDLPFWVEDEPFDYRDGILYMILIDRFANGDKASDKPAAGNLHYDAQWHGGDLAGALEVMKTGYFERLGARTIWISPINQQTERSHSGDGNQTYSAYHGYWPVKARSVEPRFGGDAGLRAFIAEAHKRGIRVIVDLINNQVHEDHEYVGPNASWFRRSCKCGDDAIGCGWSQRPYDCMFQPYLPDIDWNNFAAENQFIADAVYWLTEYDFDGFRVDAVKHVEANSIYNMRAELSRRFEQAGARIFMVGETAVGEYDANTFFGESFPDGFAWIDAYTGPNALDGQFDFPTRHNLADGLVSGTMSFDEVERQLEKSLSKYRPGALHVRFLNGHDNPRIASIAAQDPKLGCSWASGCRDEQLPPSSYSDPMIYQRLRRALTALYTLPGIPYLYQGDEVAFPGGPDPDMRRDMRFGEPELMPLHMSKPGTTPVGLTQAQLELRDFVRKLGDVRTKSRALRRGVRKTLVGTDPDLWVYAYQSGPRELAVVVLNRGSGQLNRNILAGRLNLAGVTGFDSSLGLGSLLLSGANLTLSIPAGEAEIFVAK